MWWWIILGVPCLFLLVFLLRSWGKYRQIYSDAHLLEFCETLLRIRREALDAEPVTVVLPPGKIGDPGTAMTSAGIAVIYTVSHREEDGGDPGTYHHISMSHRGGYFARPTAAFLTSCLHSLFALRGVTLHTALSRAGRYHLVFALSQEEHEEYRATEFEPPAEEEIPELRRLCMKSSAQVKFGPVPGE